MNFSAAATAGRDSRRRMACRSSRGAWITALPTRRSPPGEIDVMDLYSTDAKIERYHIAVLADDRHYFPAYDAVLLLHRADAPARHPQAFAAFARLQNSIDSRTMVRLNARAELDKVPFGEVAREYLGGGPASKRTLRAALFAPDSGRLLAEHLGLVFGSLVVAALIGVPLGVLAAKVGWLAQPVVSADRTGADYPVACPARVPDPAHRQDRAVARPDRVVPVCAFADHAQTRTPGSRKCRAGCSRRERRSACYQGIFFTG